MDIFACECAYSQPSTSVQVRACMCVCALARACARRLAPTHGHGWLKTFKLSIRRSPAAVISRRDAGPLGGGSQELNAIGLRLKRPTFLQGEMSGRRSRAGSPPGKRTASSRHAAPFSSGRGETTGEGSDVLLSSSPGSGGVRVGRAFLATWTRGCQLRSC